MDEYDGALSLDEEQNEGRCDLIESIISNLDLPDDDRTWALLNELYRLGYGDGRQMEYSYPS